MSNVDQKHCGKWSEMPLAKDLAMVRLDIEADRDSEGHPAAVLENITDITVRKWVEQARHLSAGLFSSLVEKGSFGM